MSFNAATGIITGSPVGLNSSITYTVTGTNSTGSGTFSFDMQIIPPKGLWAKLQLGVVDDICVDSLNNYYVIFKTNTTQPTYDVNGDGSVIVPASSGSGTITINIIKYNNSGTALWIKTLNNRNFGSTNRIVCDSLDNFYIVGSLNTTSGALDVNGNGSVIVAAPPTGTLIYLIKFNSSGVAQWSRSLYKSGSEASTGLTISKNNVLYLSGLYVSSLSDFDMLGDNSIILPPASMTNSFIAVYNTSGTLLNAKRISANTSVRISSLASDTNGIIYVGGNNASTTAASIDSFPLTPASTGARRNAFVVKYDSSLQAVWVKEVASFNADDNIVKVNVDNTNNVYISGMYTATSSFDISGNGSVILPISTQGDGYLVKYDSNGTALWAKTYIGVNAADSINNIAFDVDNNVYIAGTYSSSALSPLYLTPSVTVPAATGYDALVVKYNTNGEYKWYKNISNSGTESGRGIIIDSLNNIGLISLITSSAETSINSDGSLNIPSTNNIIGFAVIQYGPV